MGDDEDAGAEGGKPKKEWVRTVATHLNFIGGFNAFPGKKAGGLNQSIVFDAVQVRRRLLGPCRHQRALPRLHPHPAPPPSPQPVLTRPRRQRCNIDRARELLMMEGNVDATNTSGSSLTHVAIRTGDWRMLDLVLSFHPNVNVSEGKEVGGGTPLHAATALGNARMVKQVRLPPPCPLAALRRGVCAPGMQARAPAGPQPSTCALLKVPNSPLPHGCRRCHARVGSPAFITAGSCSRCTRTPASWTPRRALRCIYAQRRDTRISPRLSSSTAMSTASWFLSLSLSLSLSLFLCLALSLARSLALSLALSPARSLARSRERASARAHPLVCTCVKEWAVVVCSHMRIS